MLTAIQTTLKPKTFGKREQRLSNTLKTRVNVTLFKSQTPIYKVYPYISSTGKVTPIRLTLAYLPDSTTSSNNLALRPVFVSTSLDPRKYETNDGRIVFADSNEEMMQRLKHERSPFNSMVVSGTFGSANIPFDVKTWDNVEHNKHAMEFISKATVVANAPNLTDSVREKTFQDLYDQYLAKEQDLLTSGITVANSIIVANESGVQLTVTIGQNTHSQNDFFNSEKVFGNEHSMATFAPMTNEVYGSMRIGSSSYEGNWTYGLIENGATHSFSTVVNFFDFRNKMDTSPARLVIRDRFVPQEGQRSRSQVMQEFVQQNNAIAVYGAQLKIGLTELGGLTSIFSIEGDDLAYNKAQISSQDALVVSDVQDLDAEVLLDLNSMDNMVLQDQSDFLAQLEASGF